MTPARRGSIRRRFRRFARSTGSTFDVAEVTGLDRAQVQLIVSVWHRPSDALLELADEKLRVYAPHVPIKRPAGWRLFRPTNMHMLPPDPRVYLVRAPWPCWAALGGDA